MIKKFKGLLICLVALLTGFIYSSNVFAFDANNDSTGTQYLSSSVPDNISGAYRYNGSNGTYSFYGHYMAINGSNYDAFCMDAIRRSGSGNTAKLVKVLNPDDPRDVAILSIINSDASYSAKVLAERAFLVLTDYISYFDPASAGRARTGGFNFGEIYSNYNSGIIWAAEQKSATRAIFKKSIGVDLGENFSAEQLYRLTNLSSAPYYDGFDTSDSLNEDVSVVKEAKAIFVEALKLGEQVANGKGISEKTVKISKPEYQADSYEYITGQDGVRRGSRVVTFGVTFTGFDGDIEEPVTIDVNPDTNGKLKLENLEYQVLGEDNWTKFDSNTDFRSIIKKDNVTINVRAKISAVVSREASFNANFKVKVNFNDVQLARLSGAIYNISTEYLQRFFVADGDKNSKTDEVGEFPLKWTDTEGYCKNEVPSKTDTEKFREYIHTCCAGNNDEGFNIKDACKKAQKNNDQDGINTWCKLKEDYCDYCNSTIDIPRTCSEISPQEFIDEVDKTASITGPKDIKTCVWDGTDEDGQSYKLTKDSSVANNPYCNVSCKEDYTMQLPTARYTPSGRSFTLKMNITGQKTCYTDMIDYNKFTNDMNSYTETIRASLEEVNRLESSRSSVRANDLLTGERHNNNIMSEAELNQTISAKNSELDAALDGYNTALRNIKACNGGWADSYEFDPVVEFDYEEEYIDLLGDQSLKFISEDKQVKKGDTWFCNGTDVDSKYESCIGGSVTTEAPTTNLNVYNCTRTADGNSYNCESSTVTVPTARFVKKSIKGEGTYAPQSVFYTKYSSGVVTVNPDGSLKAYTKLESKLDSTIPDSDKIIKGGDLPIALKTGRGVYNYGFKFNNIGEYFNKEGMGRLVGGKESVVYASDDSEFKGTYICSYVVNCTKCKVTCEEPTEEDIEKLRKLGLEIDLDSMSCEIEDPEPCPTCDVECVGECVYDEKHGQLFTVHQTSLTYFNPTDRVLGPNLTTEKGLQMIDELEEKGETIYNEPEYSFTFTPAAIEFIRNINEESSSFTELPSKWENKSNYILYSELALQKFGKNSQEYKNALEHDYKIYRSSILEELSSSEYGSIKVKALLDTREKVESWLTSDYCKSHSCAMVGAVGPAWK